MTRLVVLSVRQASGVLTIAEVDCILHAMFLNAESHLQMVKQNQ